MESYYSSIEDLINYKDKMLYISFYQGLIGIVYQPATLLANLPDTVQALLLTIPDRRLSSHVPKSLNFKVTQYQSQEISENTTVKPKVIHSILGF